MLSISYSFVGNDMPNIFISYRRDDAPDFAMRLRDRLDREFGRDRIFMDVDDIPVGMDFRNVLELALRNIDVMVVLIGPHWLTSGTERGQRRLDDPNDFVRMEIEYALRADVHVVPVLMGDAKMPRSQELPPALRQLPYRLAVAVSHASFDRDVRLLFSALREPAESAQTAERISEPTNVVPPSWKLVLLSKVASLLGIPSAPQAPKFDKIQQVSIQTVKSTVPARPLRPNTNQHDAFMSYSRDDATIMQKVRHRLARSEISVWTDDRLDPGTPSWKKAVQSAIENAPCFIILLTPSAKQSHTVEMELGYALAHERIVLPILANGTNRTAVPFEIINRQWTDIRQEFEVGMTRLVEAIMTYRSAPGLDMPSTAARIQGEAVRTR
jgi:hypothetical protein